MQYCHMSYVTKGHTASDVTYDTRSFSWAGQVITESEPVAGWVSTNVNINMVVTFIHFHQMCSLF